MKEIGRAHVWTPVTSLSRMPSSAWKKKIRGIELIIDSGKVAGYKISGQKSLALLYTNNEKSEKKLEREIEETLIYHCNKKNKIPRNKPA